MLPSISPRRGFTTLGLPPRLRSGAGALFLLAGAGGACGGDAEAVVRPSDIGHVHDVVVDGDAVLVATHRGLLRLVDGGYRVVGGQIHDLTSMTELDGGALIASGHPDLRLEEYRVEGAPPFLGLITSSDGGSTWEAIGLLGEADFHALDVAGEIILGGDSAGAIWRLDPTGRGQPVGALPFDINDLAISPEDPAVVVATSWDGEFALSEDAGQTWALQPDAPPVFEIEWSATGLTGASASGALWSAPAPTGPFERLGEAPGGVQTLLVQDGSVWAADDRGQLHERTGDGPWSPLVSIDD